MASRSKIPPKGVISAEITGLREAKRFFKYLTGRQKNIAIKRGLNMATSAYRRELKRKTPRGKFSGEGKDLYKSVAVIESKKHRKIEGLSPIWVGHLVKKGARHQHLLVRGRDAAWAGPHPKERGGRRKRAMSFRHSKTGKSVITKHVSEQKPNDYVTPILMKHLPKITKNFEDNMIKAMDKEAKKYLKRYYRKGA